VVERYYPSPTDAAFTNKVARILFSRDGGNTWNAAKGSDGRVPLRGIAVKSGAPAVVVGDQGNIVISPDQGATWKEAVTANKNDLCAIAWSANLPLVVAVGKGAMSVYSADAGKSWKTMPVPTANLRGIEAVGHTFIAVGDKGSILRVDTKDLK